MSVQITSESGQRTPVKFYLTSELSTDVEYLFLFYFCKALSFSFSEAKQANFILSQKDTGSWETRPPFPGITLILSTFKHLKHLRISCCLPVKKLKKIQIYLLFKPTVVVILDKLIPL